MKQTLKEAHIEITHNCDLNCLICDHHHLSKEKTFLSMKTFIKFIHSRNLKNINLLSLSGGEPTFHPDFKLFLKTALKILPKAQIVILSNLMSFKRVEKALASLSKNELERLHIGSSLDGPKEVHNKLRHNPEALEKLIKNFKKLKKKFKTVSMGFTFTINRFNYKFIFETYRLSAKELKSNLGFQLIIGNQHNKSALLKKEFFPHIAKELKMVIDDILKEKPKENLYSLSDIAYLFSLFNYFNSSKKQKAPCNAGKDFLMISPEGSVYLCPLQKNTIFGNIKSDNFDNIVKTALKSHKKNYSRICEKCFSLLQKMRDKGKTIIFTTHETLMVKNFANRIIKLEDGHTSQDGPVSELEKIIKAEPLQNSGRIHATSLGKYELLFKKLKTRTDINIVQSKTASDEDLLLVHSDKWLERLKKNNLTSEEEKYLSMPNSQLLLPQAWKLAGTTIEASQNALKCGLGISAVGGGHHAKKNTGEGFCPINDIAIAIKKLQKENKLSDILSELKSQNSNNKSQINSKYSICQTLKSPYTKIKKVLIIDLDAHQGDGTAEIFQDDKNIFTFSAHQLSGYPEKRAKSSLDIELPPNIKDNEYLKKVKETLPIILKESKFDLAFYIAGADIYENDLLGEMKISIKGIKQRDGMVFKALADLRIPTILTFAGGYAKNIDDTAKICLSTVKEAIKAFPSFNKNIHF